MTEATSMRCHISLPSWATISEKQLFNFFHMSAAVIRTASSYLIGPLMNRGHILKKTNHTPLSRSSALPIRKTFSQSFRGIFSVYWQRWKIIKPFNYAGFSLERKTFCQLKRCQNPAGQFALAMPLSIERRNILTRTTISSSSALTCYLSWRLGL